MSDTPIVGLLGTGTMGAGMSRNILAAGLPLRVWNRTPQRALPLADAGASLATDPADAVRGADVIVTMLGDAGHVADVMTQAEAGFQPGQVWAQMTTCGIEQGELLGIAGDHGLRFVDAPVAGTRQPAESGELLVMAAGDPEVRPIVQPVFDAVGRATNWVDDNSSGLAASRLKLVVNNWVLAVAAAAAETVALARGLGVEPEAFFGTIAGGPLESGYMRTKAEAILAEDWAPNFSVNNAAKDADLIVTAGAANGVRLDVAAATAARYHRTAEAGHSEADLAANYLASFL